MNDPRSRNADLRVLGTTPVRADGVDKVTGRAVFAGDIQLPRMLHAAFLRSPYAHARILGFDLDAADIYVGDDENVSETDIIYDVDKWLLALPYQARTLDIGGQITSQTRTYYDGEPFVGLTLGQVTQGLVTRSTVW